jgi:acetylornithine/succinyldiaminopimelate/putrescine aminotransferase
LQIVNTPEFLADVRIKGDYLVKELTRLKELFPSAIGEIRGVGLMIGVDILKNHQLLSQKMEENKIMVNFTSETVLRLLPPLNIKKQEIDQFITTMEKILPLI